MFVCFFFQVVSKSALEDAKQLILSAFDENNDGRIDIAEVLNNDKTEIIQLPSQNGRKRTFWHVRPTKTQITLRIRAVWSVFIVRMKKICILGYPNCAKWRFWSVCAKA